MAITANAQNFPAMLRSAPAYDTDAVSQVAPVKNQTVPNRSVQEPTASGIHLSDGHATRSQMIALLDRLQLSMVVTTYLTGTGGCVFCLKDDCARQFLPNADTLELGRRLRGDTSATPLDL